ncbi:hypothetical protein JCM8097_000794 [Rhodosporidiobolus ruineniae]
MPSSSSSASLPPPRSLGDLPPELKTRIVELCAEQDERFREWLKGKSGLALELKRTQSAHGGSVSALFRTSREFSAIAAPHLFQVLKTSKVNLCFKCTVGLRRLHLFHVLHLDSAHSEYAADIFPYLPQLVKVRKLIVAKHSLDILWDYSTVTLACRVHDSPTAQYASAAFRCLRNLAEIDALSIRTTYISFRSLIPFVQNNQHSLRRLHLTVSDIVSFSGGLAELLAAAPALNDLELTSTGDLYDNRPLDLGPVQRSLTAIPPLTKLSLSVRFFHSSHVVFASYIAGSLVHLVLQATSTDSEYSAVFQQPKFTSQRLHNLTHLTLSGEDALVCQTLASLKPRHLPKLESLELDLQNVGEWSCEAGPLSTFESFPSLSSITIRDFDSLNDDDVAAVKHSCSENGWQLEGIKREVELDGSSPVEAFVDTYLWPTPKADKIRTTLDYVQRELEKAEEGANSARLERLRTVLAPLEMERQASEAWRRA